MHQTLNQNLHQKENSSFQNSSGSHSGKTSCLVKKNRGWVLAMVVATLAVGYILSMHNIYICFCFRRG